MIQSDANDAGYPASGRCPSSSPIGLPRGGSVPRDTSAPVPLHGTGLDPWTIAAEFEVNTARGRLAFGADGVALWMSETPGSERVLVDFYKADLTRLPFTRELDPTGRSVVPEGTRTICLRPSPAPRGPGWFHFQNLWLELTGPEALHGSLVHLAGLPSGNDQASSRTEPDPIEVLRSVLTCNTEHLAQLGFAFEQAVHISNAGAGHLLWLIQRAGDAYTELELFLNGQLAVRRTPDPRRADWADSELGSNEPELVQPGLIEARAVVPAGFNPSGSSILSTACLTSRVAGESTGIFTSASIVAWR